MAKFVAKDPEVVEPGTMKFSIEISLLRPGQEMAAYNVFKQIESADSDNKITWQEGIGIGFALAMLFSK